jgi:hypothetical protein
MGGGAARRVGRTAPRQARNVPARMASQWPSVHPLQAASAHTRPRPVSSAARDRLRTSASPLAS